ncbi:MAG: PepSY domain-containing protein [Bryobacteraceae bacterium]
MSGTAITIRNWVMLTHRWMGVGFCVLFLAWFVSGIVMMYCRFPHVEAEDRLSRAATLDPAKIQLAPEQAFAAAHTAGKPWQIRLNVLDGRPVYRFAFGRRPVLVFADNGERVGTIPTEMALRIAAKWTGLAAGAAVFDGLITKDDQWTVHSSVHPFGPFWKYSWPSGEEVYVSQSTGEVVQDTTRGSRLGAYFGAIPHWLYFTRLRRNGPLWERVVIWLSGVGTIMSILGLVAGVWLYSPSKRYRFPDGASSIPYAGQKRWHVVLGLIFGAVTCTWVFSGLLSMGPFSWLSDPDRPNLDRALRANRFEPGDFSAKDPRKAIAEAAGMDVKELEFASFAGDAFYLAMQAHGSRIIPLARDAQDAFGTERIVEAVKRVVAPALVSNTRIVNEYEMYYLDREHRRPLPVLYVELSDAARSAYYIDPRTGRVVESYGTRSRWERWLYHGLHSIDLPWLYARRPAWDIVVILLMLGGTALSVTSLLIAWKVIRRKFNFEKGITL